MTADTTRTDTTRQGIMALCAAMALFTVSDVFTKLTTQRLPVSETIVLRGCFSVALFAVPVVMAGSWHMVRQRASWAWGIRVLGEMGCAVTFIAALSVLPIANVVAISQTAPLVLTALGARLLGERAGWQRWSATLVGFAGMLLIIKPGVGAFNIWSLVALGAMGFIVVRDLATRALSRDVPATLVTLTSAAGVTVAGGLLAPFEGAWQVPVLREWLYLVLAAGAVAGAYYCTILAVRLADLSAIQPFRYTILLWSLLAGWTVWGEVPDRAALLGIAVIAVAGVTLFAFERRRTIVAIKV